MAKKKLEKRGACLEPLFSEVLVCNNSRYRPHIEIMVVRPENVEQQNLGTLLGVFEITDESEDSSYVVNYLISVIKKEYFSRAKRNPVESLEAALHKANLALSKLAQHGNINWMGNINAVCAVMENNNLHFSHTGSGVVFLMRARAFSEISEEISEEGTLNPLKTFTDISSGKIQEKDKVIITTRSIFEIFSFEEIKRSALRFSREEFSQFLKTALVNELERAAVLIFDVERVEEAKAPAAHRKKEELNAFSQAAFAKDAPAKKDKDKTAIAKEITEEFKKEQEGNQPKAGHLYIKEEEYPMSENSGLKSFWAIVKEWAWIIWEKLADFFSGFVLVKLKRLSAGALKKINKDRDEKLEEEIHNQEEAYQEELKEEVIVAREIASLEIEEESRSGNTGEESPPTALLIERLRIISRKTASGLKKIPRRVSRLPIPLPRISYFSKMSRMVKKLDYQQRLYALTALILIFVVPYFIVRYQNRLAEEKEAASIAEMAPATPEPVLPLANDTNVKRIDGLGQYYSGSQITKVINLKDNLYAIRSDGLTDAGSNKSFDFPAGFGPVQAATGMEDLNLIFLLGQNNKLIAFSPISGKFEDDSLNLPAGAKIADLGTFMTYLYALDSQGNQIYRYPRSEAGFSDKTDWLKDTLSLSNATSMALNENVYVADGDTITKLFRGQKQSFSPSTATPIKPLKLYTKTGMDNLYVLDQTNSRILKLDPNGTVLSQYYNSGLARANDFTVKESSQTIYISTPSSVESLMME